MSNTVQLVELGAPNDRPWGQTFAGFSRDRLSGELRIVEGDRTYRVAFSKGAVVGAESPLATDAAVRVARLANLISPTQVSNFVRKYGATPGPDEIALIAEVAKLSPAQTIDLRRKVVAHRAARTFSIESPGVAVVPRATIEIVPGIELDARGIVYQGARNNLSEQRLSAELAKMGNWFRIKPGAFDELDAFGFGDAERTPLDRLCEGGTLAELETCAPGIETRMVRAMIYALCAGEACRPYPSKPAPTRRAIDSITDDQMLAPRAEIDDLVAPRPVTDLDDLMTEHADLPAPVYAGDLAVPVESGRERTDTVLDTVNRVDLVGVTVDDRYVLERKLGEGAMGAVYLAHHTRLDRMFAVKVLHRRLLGNSKSRRRFEREAELTSRLSHENVVRVVDVGAIQDLPYLAMEFCEGGSLATVMVDAPLPAARAIHLLRQLCGGLHHAHEAGLVHRDLKPSNVIVDSAGDTEALRIVDFGIAILNEPEGSERLTTRGVVLGTPDYMAPELALGRQIDHRLDLYALGVIAFEMLAGVRPFTGDGVDVALANVNQPVPTMRERAPNATVDPLLEALTRTLLAKDPDARPANAAEVRRLLDLIEKDRPAAAAALAIAPPGETPEPASAATPEPEHAAAESTSTSGADEPRQAIKTRAMWQLKRDEGMPPLAAPAAPAPIATTRGVAVRVTPVDPLSTDPTIRPPAPQAKPPPPGFMVGRTGMRRITPPQGSGTRRETRDMMTDEIRPLRSRWLIIAGVALVVLLIVVILAIKSRSGGSIHELEAPRNYVKAPVVEAPSPPPAPPPMTSPDPTPPPKKADPPKTPAKVTKPDTSAAAIRDLYISVGKELAELSRAVGESLTAELMRRYRLIRFAQSIQTAQRRAAAHEVLAQLQRDTRALRDATASSP